MSLSKMKVSTKLALGFSMLLVFLCVVAIIGVSRMTVLKSNIADLTGVRVPQLEILYSLMKDFDLSARAVRNLALTTSESENVREKEKYETGKSGVFGNISKLEKMITTATGKAVVKDMTETATAMYALMDKALILGLANKNAELGDMILNQILSVQNKFLEASETAAGMIQQLSEKKGEDSNNVINSSRIALIVTAIIGLLAGTWIAFAITRSITKPIVRVIEGLTDASAQVVSASSQVSSASQQLAEGSSEMAAGIEETSSSLEEMSSMTKQNAENADQANTLMSETLKVVSMANGSMTLLTESMKAISGASEETSKIIKTIDEIAFQTNLLALNAAVEAARAGEAGAGFAVVADEVRSLAMRASEAAKNTAALIEGTVKKVKDGSSLVEKTDAEFQRVADSNAKVGQLVSEIAASSKEQASGIEQINKAIAEMDKATQHNAANAEESASASEEMRAQAEQMKGMVNELIEIVEGASTGAALGEESIRRTNHRTKSEAVQQIPARLHRPNVPARLVGANHNPKKVIPMEGDFENF